MSALQYNTEELEKLAEQIHEGIIEQGFNPTDALEDYSIAGETVTYENEGMEIEMNYLSRGASVAAINSHEGDAYEVLDNVVEASDDLERFRKEIQQSI